MTTTIACAVLVALAYLVGVYVGRREAMEGKSTPMGYGFAVEEVDGGFQANFYGGNGELVWWTETYKERRDAEHAIELIRGAGTKS